MNRRARSVSETSVGLFAFLDVLMSTMGSLILVLMVVTPKIRQEAVAKAAAQVHAAGTPAKEAVTPVKDTKPVETKPSAYVPTPVIELPRVTIDLNDKLKAQLAELSQQTNEQRQLTQSKHDALMAAQASLQKNQAQIEELERKLEQILREKDRLAQSVTQVSSAGIEIESQLARNGARLRKLRGQIAETSTAYTFVAYDGVSGTTRHPILIECTREHIKFLQENIALSSVDVSGFSPSYNPVLAGARALLDYWSTHSAADEPRPYVLLIVRPSGTIAYYTARRLLEPLKDAFGYELLSDDHQLNIPPSVPEATEACRKAVQKAIAERVDVFKDVFGADNRGGRRGRPGAGGSGANGTGKTGTQGGGTSPFDDLDGAPNQPSQPGSGTSGSTVAQSESGSAGRVSIRGGSNPNGTSDSPTGGNGAPGAPTPGTATTAAGSPGGDGRPGSGMGSWAGTPGSEGNIGGPGSGPPSGTGPSQGASTGNGSAIAGTPGSGPVGAPGDATGRGPGIGGTGQGGPNGAGPNAGPPVGGSFAGGGSPDSGFATTRMRPSSGTGDEPGVAGNRSEFPPAIVPRSMGDAPAAPNATAASDRVTIGHPTPGSAGNESSNDNGEGPPQTSSGSIGGLESGTHSSVPSLGLPQSGLMQRGPMQPGGTLSGGDPTAGNEGGSLRSGSATMGSDQPGSGEPGTGQGGSQGMPQSAAAGQPDSGQPGGSPSFGSSASAPGGAAGGQAGSDSEPPGTKAMDGLPSFSTQAEDNGGPRRRGQQTSHQWGIASPGASIGFEHDLTVYVEARRICVGSQRPIICGRGETSDQLAFAFLRAVDQEARSWGRPRENFYWVPNLKIVICPGGILPYERFEPVLERHGLSSSVDFRMELSRPGPMPSLVTPTLETE